ncbi:MAG: alpha/beta hydrolase [Reyranella sp.]|nr:MAG: alpha/beta hydrolase [Reyranella sp.]
MATTVYFATNRVINPPADRPGNYTFFAVPPDDAEAVTYGTAFVEGANLAQDKVGTIKSIQSLNPGGFKEEEFQDLANGKRNILVFIHGFANSFEDAITRAAFNREWFKNCGVTDADTAVVAFSWPSRGQVITLPFVMLPYGEDQEAAGKSGMPISRFFSNLLPILEKARENGQRTFLLAHSMGNVALQVAVETWFAKGNGDAHLFDEAILAAADVANVAFTQPAPLCALRRLVKRITFLYSSRDRVLDVLSENLNNVMRLGQDGPLGRADAALFPAATYQMIDCSGFFDYDYGNFQASHQYYRRSVGARAAVVDRMKVPAA